MYLAGEKCSSKAIKDEKMEESDASPENKLKEELGLQKTPDCHSDSKLLGSATANIKKSDELLETPEVESLRYESSSPLHSEQMRQTNALTP